MTNNPPQHTRVENLLAQDTAITTFHFEEFRMQLESSIKRLERRADFLNRASWYGAAVLVAIIVSVLPMEYFKLFTMEWVRMIWAGFGQVVLFTTAVMAGLFQYRYKPALERAKSDLQMSLFAQLQAQVAELSRKLDKQSS
jgi:hypothetical protein